MKVLPTIAVHINRIRSLVLLDKGSLRSLISRPLCHSWKRKEVEVLNVGERTIRCSGVGFVQPDMSNRRPINVEVPVVDRKLLGFDLLLGFDVIKKLGGVCVISDGTVSFPKLNRSLFASITINELDFHEVYDENWRILVVPWKWSGYQLPA